MNKISNKSGIYKITNTLNNKIYIGQATNLQIRIHTHQKYDTPEKYNGSIFFENEKRMPIHQAIMKYHLKNFKIEILEECDIQFLNDREKYWIKYYNCKTPNGYNLTDGGQGSGGKKGEESHFNKYSKEQILKVKKLLKQGLPPFKVFQQYNEVSMDMIYSINQGKTWKEENETYPLNKKQGSIFSKEDKENIYQEFLLSSKNIGKMKSYDNLSKKYNCSAHTIMRIIKQHEI